MSFRNNNNIFIKLANEDDTIVVMNEQEYLEEVFSQISDCQHQPVIIWGPYFFQSHAK